MNVATLRLDPAAMAVGFAEALIERVREDGQERRHLKAVGTKHEEEKKQSPRSLWRYAGQAIGPVLLAAADADELEAKLELVVESDEFHAIQRLWHREWDAAPDACADCPLAKEPRERAKVPAKLRGKYELILGRDALELVDEARWYSPAICSALARLYKATGAFQGPSDGLGFLATAPVGQARAMLSGLKGTAAHYAISYAIESKTRLPGWLAEGLAQAYRDGSREYLKLLASDPRAGVSEEMIPAAERMHLDPLRAEADRMSAELAALAARPRDASKRIISIAEA